MKMNENIEKIWSELGTKLKAFIISKVNDETLADDILQEVFIKVHSNIDKLKDDTKIQSWIYQITRNLISDHFRHIQKEQKKILPGFENETETEDEFDSGEDIMSETLTDMAKMMDEMPKDYCEALCLTDLGGMTQKAYADKIGISHTAAKARVRRAKIMLKDMLMKCCHYQFDKYGTVIDIHPANCCCCSN